MRGLFGVGHTGAEQCIQAPCWRRSYRHPQQAVTVTDEHHKNHFMKYSSYQRLTALLMATMLIVPYSQGNIIQSNPKLNSYNHNYRKYFNSLISVLDFQDYNIKQNLKVDVYEDNFAKDFNRLNSLPNLQQNNFMQNLKLVKYEDISGTPVRIKTTIVSENRDGTHFSSKRFARSATNPLSQSPWSSLKSQPRVRREDERKRFMYRIYPTKIVIVFNLSMRDLQQKPFDSNQQYYQNAMLKVLTKEQMQQSSLLNQILPFIKKSNQSSQQADPIVPTRLQQNIGTTTSKPNIDSLIITIDSGSQRSNRSEPELGISTRSQAALFPDETQRPDICFTGPLVGNCQGAFKRYYYNSSLSQCDCYFYGGCPDDQQQSAGVALLQSFHNLRECVTHCVPSLNHTTAHCTPPPTTFFFDEEER